MAEVTSLYRYPVKGLSPERLGQVALEPGRAFPLDRLYALALHDTVFDEAAPEPLPKTAFLMLMRQTALAALDTAFDPDSGRLSIGRRGKVLISADLDDPVGRAAIAGFFAGYLGVAMPRVVRAPGHRFTDLSVVSPRLMEAVSVINIASVKALAEVVGRPLDPMRFRANIYLDGLPAWEEFDWIDRDIAIGQVAFRAVKRTQRCAAVDVNPATAERDEELPAVLRRSFGHADMGIYLDVLGAGTLSEGDAVVASVGRA